MIAALRDRTTVLDRLVVALLLALVVASALWAAQRPAGARVVVERDGQVVFSAPLSEPRSARLSGPLGETVMEIEDGRARVLSSPCPTKACMGMGPASRQGDLLACVPNHLIVRIEGGRQEDTPPYDMLSR
ncbi:MAG TPA: NusG domain II-containing protein [Geoalkalibacter subterraneus]|uniref:NusG domain II-containing protein n=1 Tax=Geoalkalibacter subterraneus TaxID=483547 RepID=A0A831LHW1_9BACT|nr:NusG domain II-containing protein [Geoalkalibacter subterraneus]